MASLLEPYIPDTSKWQQSALQGYALGDKMRSRNLLVDAGQQMAAGNLKGARNTLYQGGDFDEGGKIDAQMRAQFKEAKTERLEHAAKFQSMIGNIAMRADTPEKWAQAIDGLKQRGLDVSKYANFSSRDIALAESGKVMDLLKLELEERKAAAGNGTPFKATKYGVMKPNMEESARPYVDMAANAEQGFGVGAGLMVAKNAVGDVFGKDPVPLDTETALRTRAAEARGDPHTISNRSAATTAGEADRARDARLAGLRARTAAELRTEAKALGLPTSGLKDDLARRIASAPESSPAPSVARRAARGASKAMIPLAVGYGVYDALRSPAEAGQADVARYAADRLDPGGDTLASFSDAYEDYKRYAQSRGEQPIPERAFQRQLRSSNVGMARVGGADRITASIRPAEAATRVTAEGTSRATAAAAGGAAAAGTAGGMKLGSKLAGYVADAATKTPLGRVAMKTGARVLPVAGGVLAAYDIGNFVAESARPAPENDAFAEQYDRTHPRFDPDAVAMERAKARQAARMPMQSAASLELPTNIRPGSAVTADRQAAMNSDDFDAQLQAFYAAIDDHNAGLGETYGP